MLQKFIKENRAWVEQVSAVLRAKRAYTIDQYVTAIGKSTYRFDELAMLLILTGTQGTHICSVRGQILDIESR